MVEVVKRDTSTRFFAPHPPRNRTCKYTSSLCMPFRIVHHIKSSQFPLLSPPSLVASEPSDPDIPDCGSPSLKPLLRFTDSHRPKILAHVWRTRTNYLCYVTPHATFHDTRAAAMNRLVNLSAPPHRTAPLLPTRETTQNTRTLRISRAYRFRLVRDLRRRGYNAGPRAYLPRVRERGVAPHRTAYLVSTGCNPRTIKIRCSYSTFCTADVKTTRDRTPASCGREQSVPRCMPRSCGVQLFL